MTHETELTLGNLELCIEIEFTRSRRIPATYWEPAEGGEIEIECVTVTAVSGETYDLDRDELMDRGWDTWLDELAWDAVFQDNEIHYMLHDIADHDKEHDHDF